MFFHHSIATWTIIAVLINIHVQEITAQTNTGNLFMTGPLAESPLTPQGQVPSDGVAQYSYGYKTEEPENATFSEQFERRNGDATNGFYSVLLPDGRVQVVNYVADEGGYRATVTYESSNGSPLPAPLDPPGTVAQPAAPFSRTLRLSTARSLPPLTADLGPAANQAFTGTQVNVAGFIGGRQQFGGGVATNTGARPVSNLRSNSLTRPALNTRQFRAIGGRSNNGRRVDQSDNMFNSLRTLRQSQTPRQSVQQTPSQIRQTQQQQWVPQLSVQLPYAGLQLLEEKLRKMQASQMSNQLTPLSSQMSNQLTPLSSQIDNQLTPLSSQIDNQLTPLSVSVNHQMPSGMKVNLRPLVYQKREYQSNALPILYDTLMDGLDHKAPDNRPPNMRTMIKIQPRVYSTQAQKMMDQYYNSKPDQLKPLVSAENSEETVDSSQYNDDHHYKHFESTSARTDNGHYSREQDRWASIGQMADTIERRHEPQQQWLPITVDTRQTTSTALNQRWPTEKQSSAGKTQRRTPVKARRGRAKKRPFKSMSPNAILTSPQQKDLGTMTLSSETSDYATDNTL